MERNYEFGGYSEELTFVDYDYIDLMQHDLREDKNAKPMLNTATGELVYPKVQRFDCPEFTARLRRTKTTGEDIIIIQPRYRDTETRAFVENPKDTLYGRNVLLPSDIQKLWPGYREDMTREEVNALPAIHPSNLMFRFGVYLEVNEKGEPLTNLDGTPKIHEATKWLSFIIDGNKFEASGDKRKYVPASAAAEQPAQGD